LYQDLAYYQDNDNPDHNQDKPSNKHRNQRIASRGLTRPESTSNIIRGNDDRFGMLFKIRHITISLLEFGGKFSFVGSESGLQGSMITGPVGLRRLIRQQTDRDGPGRSMMIGKGDAPTGTPSAEYDLPDKLMHPVARHCAWHMGFHFQICWGGNFEALLRGRASPLATLAITDKCGSREYGRNR
jgi:hypothetical protein